MIELGVNNESEPSEDSTNSDIPKTPVNEPNYSENQRDSTVVSKNKAKMKASNLQNIANSLVDLGQNKGKRKITQLRRSKRVSKNTKIVPNYHGDGDEDDDDGDGDGDGGMNDSSKEIEDEGIVKKMKKNNKEKKKKNVGNGCEIMEIARFYSQEDDNVRKFGSNSKRVEVPLKVLIPDSSLQFTGYCEEKIQLVFPKASEDEVRKLMDRFPKEFSGFNREQGERVLRWISGLKEDYWKLRRLHTEYPEFREEVVEGLPFPEGFEGFDLEESKQISGVIVTLEAAYSRLRDYFQSDVNEGAKGLQSSERREASVSHPLEASCPPTTLVATPVKPDVQMLPYRFPGSRPFVHHEASVSHPLETPWPPSSQASGPQQQASTFAASPVQSDVPMSSRFPNYRQYPPNWCPPFGMSTPWNPYNPNYPPPSMGSYPGMPYFDAGMHPSTNNPRMSYYDAGRFPFMGNYPGMPNSYNNGNT